MSKKNNNCSCDVQFDIIEKEFDTPSDKEKNELFSIIISSYKNLSTLTQSISSVLEQKYPRIELIVGDDGSDNFQMESISEYIVSNRKENLERFVIRKFNEN
jgi:cellulose synthase/poly-beta-1,6-N-acetylglucosamine synthase-like glycosyltransferase